MLMKLCLLAICLTISSCYRQPQAPLRELTFYADPAFSPNERRKISEATRELMSQANVAVHVIYDDGFGNPTKPKIVRMAPDASLTKDLDKQYHGVVFGWTLSIRPVVIYLVSDRLIGEDFALHVVLHELLHALGCDHVQDPDAVLYGVTDGQHMATKLTPTDIAQLMTAPPGKGGE